MLMTACSKAWASNNGETKPVNNSQNGGEGRVAAKFMEVDGTISEISGDIDVVNVRMRESGRGDMGNQNRNQLEIFKGGNFGAEEIAVTDSKRKRVEDNMDGEIIGEYDIPNTKEQSQSGPKNGELVGSGFQAHQPL